MGDFAITPYLSAQTQALIDACGGLIPAALECDISKTQLQRAADPNNKYTLKASTIWHLEQACGQPIMSRALLHLSDEKLRANACPLYLGIDFADKATDLTVAISSSLKDGKISVIEHRRLTSRTAKIQTRLAQIVKSVQPRITGTRAPKPELESRS